MKLLLLLLTILTALWMLRGTARSRPSRGRTTQMPPESQTMMLRCAHCGLHLPSTEALSSQDGKRSQSFCSAAHAQKFSAKQAYELEKNTSHSSDPRP
jgi:uncharacterized protein